MEVTFIFLKANKRNRKKNEEDANMQVSASLRLDY